MHNFHWHGNVLDINATNESGFSGLPGGSRFSYGPYGDVGILGNWWSSSEFDTFDAWYRNLDYSSSIAAQSNGDKKNGFSVRCLKD